MQGGQAGTRKRLRRGIYILPNLITISSLMFGDEQLVDREKN